MSTYPVLYWLSVGATVLFGGWTLIQAEGGRALGLDQQTMAWLGIAFGMLGIAKGFLPSVLRPPNDERKGLD